METCAGGATAGAYDVPSAWTACDFDTGEWAVWKTLHVRLIASSSPCAALRCMDGHMAFNMLMRSVPWKLALTKTLLVWMKACSRGESQKLRLKGLHEELFCRTQD